ncbi:Flp family type IVb pilin [Parablastomonas sp. CN1-191]|uniref:Flp family type IVb pilin n=1 Tax=Parablastomonas sp. CN1-191 TaxID=3400908 RepID=UPI003BF881CD
MIRTKLKTLIDDARGATAIEYGLICALIVVGLLAGLSSIGGQNGNGWGMINNRVTTAVQSSTS